MSKGAKVCGVTQSAASQHVQEVERRLGSPLLDRSKRPLEMTPTGKLYADFCRDVLQQEDEFQLALERLKLEVEGTVRVASIYSVGLSEMSRLSEEFAASHPTARLEVEYMRPDRIYAALRSGEADLGLVSYPESSREIAICAMSSSLGGVRRRLAHRAQGVAEHRLAEGAGRADHLRAGGGQLFRGALHVHALALSPRPGTSGRRRRRSRTTARARVRIRPHRPARHHSRGGSS
jgi:DNA-binding transcriptional LysR family regulator